MIETLHGSLVLLSQTGDAVLLQVQTKDIHGYLDQLRGYGLYRNMLE